jgi:4-hydroxy-tetrahydrodipicolinate synthase
VENGFFSTAHLAGARSQSHHSERVSTGEFDNAMNKKIEWQGVLPAITTPFNHDLSVDHGFLAEHCQWLINKGCKGLVAAGSLGEGATLSLAEKDRVLETCVKAVGEQAYVVAGISSLSTAEAVAAARSAEKIGCDGLMVLPPYVYVGDWREMQSHVSAVISATSLSVMLYNNPIAYKTDFLPGQVRELLDRHPNLQAIKESSADVRRVSALRAIAGGRLKILCGVDDEIVEAVYAGAVGWIAGLVNAFPQESVDLFELASQGKKSEAFELYSWFLPLLHLDVVPKFVQLIKLVQEEVGMGSQRVRPPRLPLTGQELEDTKRLVADSLKRRPTVRVAAQ